MRKLFAVVVIALACSSSAFAQRYNLPNPVQAVLDAPAAGAVVSPHVMFGGWAFNWRTCRHASSVILARVNLSTKEVVFVPSTVYWGPRPDVQAYAQWGGCQAAEIALGFTLIPNEPQPYGPWQYSLLVTDLQADPDALNWTAPEIRRKLIVQ